MQVKDTRYRRRRVVTTERTSKRYKAAMAIAQVLATLSPFAVIVGALLDPAWNWSFLSTGPVMLVVAVVLAVYAKIGAWWHND